MGEGNNAINKEEVAAENRRAPSRMRRSSLENDRFAGGGSWALRAGTLTRLPPFVRPPRLTMPFGDDGMTSASVVWSRRDVASTAVRGEQRQGGGWSMGSSGSDRTKGVVSGRWEAAGESVGSGRGGGGGKNYGCLSLAYFCREPTVGNIQWEKKNYFPTQVGNIPGEAGKNSFFFPEQLYWAL